MGNIIELCAASMYPDPKIYLGFTMCLTRDYQDIPQRSLVEDCALEHGIDFGKLNECVGRDDGGFGIGMLRDSVRRSTEVCLRVVLKAGLLTIIRPVSPNPAQSDWMRKYTVYATEGNGQIAPTVLESTISLLRWRNSTILLHRLKNLRPKFTSFSNRVM